MGLLKIGIGYLKSYEYILLNMESQTFAECLAKVTTTSTHVILGESHIHINTFTKCIIKTAKNITIT